MPERLALIGAGTIGKRHVKAIADTGAAELVAIADPNPQAGEFAESCGVPYYTATGEMLSAADPAGVIVATPTEQHIDPCLEASRYGCHLLVEKPIAATLDEATQIALAAEEKGLHVLVGHHRRYYPQVEKARELLQQGAIGKPVAVSGQWCVRKHDDYYGPEWRRRWKAGPVMTNLVHEIDYLRYILGSVASVQAEFGNDVQGYEKEDAVAYLLRFTNGVLGAFVLTDQADSPWAWEFSTGENPFYPRSGENCIRFVGTEGALDFPNLTLWTSTDSENSWYSPKQAQSFPLDLGDAFIRQIDHFCDVIAGKADPKITAADAAETLKVTLAVRQAGSSGKRIAI
ncbi:MAG: Gfo/Idh/MocA family protein [Rhizobiaceae bacterium]